MVLYAPHIVFLAILPLLSIISLSETQTENYLHIMITMPVCYHTDSFSLRAQALIFIIASRNFRCAVLMFVTQKIGHHWTGLCD